MKALREKIVEFSRSFLRKKKHSSMPIFIVIKRCNEFFWFFSASDHTMLDFVSYIIRKYNRDLLRKSEHIVVVLRTRIIYSVFEFVHH